MESAPLSDRSRGLAAPTFADTHFVMEASFNAVSDLICGDSTHWSTLTTNDKVLSFTSLMSHQRKDIRLGGAIALFLILKSTEVDEEVTNLICEELFMALADHRNQENVFIQACLEVIG